MVQPRSHGPPLARIPTGYARACSAKGWVLLGQVSLGYELWRRLNGFPPLPSIEKGAPAALPSAKKPRAPVELK